MTEFNQEARHYCRNKHCRSKLPGPVSNPREAFCTKGCHGSFYLKRCMVCEGPIERKREDQKVCRKAKCRSAWRARSGFGRYHGSSDAKLASKTPGFIDSKQPPKPCRPWRIVAGPELSPSAFRCAAVGAAEAVEAAGRINDRHWREANAAAETRMLIKPYHPPVNVLGGYQFPGALFVDLRQPASTPAIMPPTGDALDIPEFLQRRLPARLPETEAA
jgi:hypothetical protein